MVDPSHSFHFADYCIFGITLALSIAIGIYYSLSGGRQRTTDEYLLGGRVMRSIPLAISLLVSYDSSTLTLGVPAEMYVYGVQLWWSSFGFFVAVMFACLIMVPLLYPLKITSAYEYLEYRFKSTAVRLLGCVLGMFFNVWYMGSVLFGPAIALQAVTGFPWWSSMFVVAFVAVVYTSIGGIKAVIWVDVFQAGIMYVATVAIVIKGTMEVGSAADVWNIAEEGGRLEFFNFDVDPRTRHSFWCLFFGVFIRGTGFAFNQATVQRVSSAKTQQDAKWMLMIMGPCLVVVMTMSCYEGIVAFAYYQRQGCHPLVSGEITDPNQILPYVVMDLFRSIPGMPGLFLAAIFSSALSTLSSILSGLSALLWADFIKPRIGQVSDFKATAIAKISVVVFGILGYCIALLVSLVGGPMTQVTASLVSAAFGPLTGLFILGCFNPWANAKGAFVGVLLSLIISAWMSLGQAFARNVKREPWLPFASTYMCLANHSGSAFNATPSSVDLVNVSRWDVLVNHSYYDNGSVYGGYHSTVAAGGFDTTTPLAVLDDEPQGLDVMYSLSYQWLAAVGTVLAFLLGTLISIATGGNKEGEVDPRYIVSFCDRLCCYLPESVRKRFRCADYTTVQGATECPATRRIPTTEADELLNGNNTLSGVSRAGEQGGGCFVSVSVPGGDDVSAQDDVERMRTTTTSF